MHNGKVSATALGTLIGVAMSLANLFPGAAWAAESARPSVESFFTPAKLTEAELSPDGKFVALAVRGADEHMKLAVMDLSAMEPKVVGGFTDVDVGNINWVNNQRLTFSVYSGLEAQGDLEYYPGLFAVNRDGSDTRTLVERSTNLFVYEITPTHKNVLPGNTYFAGVDESGKSDDIFVVQPTYSNTYDVTAMNLMRVDTRTGHATSFDRPGDAVDWTIDDAGVPRICETLHEGKTAIYYRDPANEKWRKLIEFDAYEGGGFRPLEMVPDGYLYVVARVKQDTSALYRYDLQKNAMDAEPLISVKGYDFNGSLIFDHAGKKLLGVRYVTDAQSTLWFDEGMKKIQQRIDALLPATINQLRLARGAGATHILVKSYSDVSPTSFLVYDTASDHLTLLGSSRPGVNPRQMAQQDMVHYAARDGLSIPAYLTLPNGANKKNLPLVVLVHGGPYMRGTVWGWDAEVQFLASRGYAVLQPEFRGSDGFGAKFFRAGWKQWGLAMQNDVADGAKWAVAQGIADPKRICIAGASYGGYATLMGLANDPDLFRCGVDWVGVTDINLMFKPIWISDQSEEWRHFGMPVMVGDPVKDAEQLKATSPVNIAQRIKQPLLMAYGGADPRVPIEHGEKFHDAIKPYNDKVQWIEYSQEGHGWYLLKTNVDFWTRVEKFLDENIGH